MNGMLLSAGDPTLIVVTTLLCAGGTMALVAAALRLNRRGSVSSQFALVVAGVAVSVLATTLVVLGEMYFSRHDVVVLAWVVGVAGLVNGVCAWWLTRRTVRRAADALVESATRVGDGNVVDVDARDWKEFTRIGRELAESSARLAEAREQVRALDRARRNFLAGISHDLRTPLAGARAAAEALEDGVTEENAGYLPLIRARIDAVVAMVDDLFRLSTLESGTLTLHPADVDLLDLVSDVVTDLMPEARRRGVTIAHADLEGHPVWADPQELGRAVGNLVSNAVRHAPEGSEVLITAHRRDDGHVVVGVLDHGSGVDSADLGRIFDAGWRAASAREGPDHAGLGLAIVRGVAEAHGGTVSATTSDEGFRVELALPGHRT